MAPPTPPDRLPTQAELDAVHADLDRLIARPRRVSAITSRHAGRKRLRWVVAEWRAKVRR
jgi:hypothetical protein